jgi:hypothetical protein
MGPVEEDLFHHDKDHQVQRHLGRRRQLGRVNDAAGLQERLDEERHRQLHHELVEQDSSHASGDLVCAHLLLPGHEVNVRSARRLVPT